MAGFSVVPLSCDYAEEWDALVACSTNGTIFHRRRFIDYHPPDRFTDASCLLLRGESIVGVFPAAIVETSDSRVLKSHPGTSYGGIVVEKPPGAHDADRLVECVWGYARAKGCDRIEFRLAPWIFRGSRCEEIDSAWWRRGCSPAHMELTTFYDLSPLVSETPSDEEVIATFSRDSCRASTRKALRSNLHAVMRHDEGAFIEYWDILAENVARHDAKPTHTSEELVRLKGLFPSDIQLVAVSSEGKMVAGVLLFMANSRAAHTFYMAGLREYRSACPLNLAVLRTIQHCRQAEVRYLNFGISTERGGREMNWGLFLFKEGFGGESAVRTYWRGQLDADGR